MAKDVITSFYFLPRDPKWQKEKPYTLKFTPVQKFDTVNGDRVEHSDILVEDIRGRETSFSVEDNGFAVMPLNVPDMSHEEYFDDSKVISVYLKAVGEQLKEFLHAERVQVFDFVVRRALPLVEAFAKFGRFAKATLSFPSLLEKSMRTSNQQTSCIWVCTGTWSHIILILVQMLYH